MNDSLPYVDEPHEDYEDYAAQLLEEEMKRIVPRPLDPMPAIRFRTPMMQAEFQRISESRESPAITDPVLKAPTLNTVDAWEAAVRQAKIAYEKERIRKVVLKISKEGSTTEQWKQMNATLDLMKTDLERSLQEQRALVDAVNLQRQTDQQKMGQELHVLSTQHAELIDKRQQLKRAIAQLKEELGDTMRSSSGVE
jgi:hypothetical protein